MPSDTYILTISDAGVSVPSSHASTHITGGSDAIPTATSTASGLMSPAIFTQHGINTTKVSNVTHTGDVTDAAGVLTVGKINGVALAPLGTGILRLASGVPSIATEAQFPTLNQSTTGNANTATTATNLAGGGVGQVPYQTGSGATAMLAAGTAGYVLKSNGSAAPSWSQVNISSETTGTLPVASGGTGAATFTAGILKANNTSAFITTPAPNGDIVGTNDIQTLTNKTLGTGTTFSNPISVGNGGTGASTFTAGILTANGANAFSTTPAPSGDLVGTTAAQTITNKTFGSGTVFSTPIGVASGGTGLTSYTIGDIVYANTSSSLAKLPDVATGSALISGGIGDAPLYGKIGLTTHVSGTLPVANGGTGLSSITGYVKGTGTSALSESLTIPVADISGTLPVSKGGTGVTDASTGYGGVVLSTLPTLVTPILGTPTSGTLTSCTGLPLTTGVTGILPIANGGTGVTALASGFIKSNGTILTSSAAPISIADGGTGVTQSTYGEYYISSIAATSIGTTGTFVKVSGTTTAGFLSNFTHPASNRLTYTGTATRKFLVAAALSFHGTATNDYKFAFHKNTSSLLSPSIISTTGSGGGDLAHVSCQTIVELATNDFIEVFVTNADATNGATIDFMNVTAVALI
jgi:hypothetical protein